MKRIINIDAPDDERTRFPRRPLGRWDRGAHARRLAEHYKPENRWPLTKPTARIARPK